MLRMGVLRLARIEPPILDSRKAQGVKYLGHDTRAGLVGMIKSHNHHDDLRED